MYKSAQPVNRLLFKSAEWLLLSVFLHRCKYLVAAKHDIKNRRLYVHVCCLTAIFRTFSLAVTEITIVEDMHLVKKKLEKSCFETVREIPFSYAVSNIAYVPLYRVRLKYSAKTIFAKTS